MSATVTGDGKMCHFCDKKNISQNCKALQCVGLHQSCRDCLKYVGSGNNLVHCPKCDSDVKFSAMTETAGIDEYIDMSGGGEF